MTTCEVSFDDIPAAPQSIDTYSSCKAHHRHCTKGISTEILKHRKKPKKGHKFTPLPPEPPPRVNTAKPQIVGNQQFFNASTHAKTLLFHANGRTYTYVGEIIKRHSEFLPLEILKNYRKSSKPYESSQK